MGITNYWSPGTYYGIGEKLVLKDGRQMSVLLAGMSSYGTSGVNDPQWPETVGMTVLDGTVMWMCITGKKPVVFVPEWGVFKNPCGEIVLPETYICPINGLPFEPEPEPELYNLFEEREI